MKAFVPHLLATAALLFAGSTSALEVRGACKHAVGTDGGTILLVKISCKSADDCNYDFPKMRIGLAGEEVTGDADATVAWQVGSDTYVRHPSGKFPANAILDLSQWQQIKSSKARITIDGAPITPEFSFNESCKAYPKPVFETLEIDWPLR